MADWSTISGLATGFGTLVLAIATFASVRSANRAARAAERSLLVNIRPLLIPSRPEDPTEKVGFVDDHWLLVQGGSGAGEVEGDNIYLAMALKNAGSGLALLDRWYVHPIAELGGLQDPPPPEGFRRLSRDLYIPPNDFGFWQGAIRERSDSQWYEVSRLITERDNIVVDLLYSDLEGGQRTITRFVMRPRHEKGGWIATSARHWWLDGSSPR